MKSSGQSSWSLSRKITPLSKWIEWLSELSNYFGSKRPPTLKVYTWELEAEVHGWKKPLVQSLKQFHACFYSLYEKGMIWAIVSFQGLHTSDAFRCPNISASVTLKSFWPWCLKLGGTPKQSLSILVRCIIGWQLCVMYAGILSAWMHRTSSTTILGVKPSVTGNAWNRRDRKRWRSPSPRGERRHPNYPAQRSPKDHKSRLPLNTFCLVQPENVNWCHFWSFLDPLGFISWVSPHSIRQTVTSFFSHNVYDVMVLMLTILSYVSILTY